MNQKIIVISGPTASGKSRIANYLYDKISSVIINADALQIYNALPILTAQPTDRFNSKKYQLYGVLDKEENCSVARWLALVKQSIDNALDKGLIPLIVGGTGFYIQSLLYDSLDVPLVNDEVRNKIKMLLEEIGREKFYELLCTKDPGIEKAIHKNDTYRMIRAAEVFEQTGKSVQSFMKNGDKRDSSYDYLHIFLDQDRESLYESCNERFLKMTDNGVVEEVEQFANSKTGNNKYAVERAFGYQYLLEYTNGTLSLADAIECSQRATRNYAKRQYTWFRNQMPNKVSLKYNDYSEVEGRVLALIKKFL